MAEERRKALITDILLAMKAGGAYLTGEVLFFLAFRTESELKEIAAELHITVRG